VESLETKEINAGDSEQIKSSISHISMLLEKAL
jgi:hypothetical protein